MSNNNKGNTQEHIADASLVPNEFLASKRKQKGIGERDAADALKISVARLRSIEAGNYKEFPSETYVRGHLRNYSRFLELDEEAVVAAYNVSHPPSFDYINPEKNTKTNGTAPKAKHAGLFVLLLFALVAAFFVKYNFLDEVSDNTASSDPQAVDIESSVVVSPAPESSEVDEVSNAIAESNGHSETTGDESSEPKKVAIDEQLVNESVSALAEQALASEVSVDVAEQLSVPNAGLSNEDASTLSDENAPVLPLNDISSQPDIVVSQITAAELVKSVMNADEASPAEVEAELSAVDNTLLFSFENPCWVEVVDVNGKVVFIGLKPAGSNLRVSGDAPFNIVLGNVEGTALTYNGESVALEKQVNGRPLRFVVGG